MLKNILKRPVTVIMFFTAVTVFGIISYQKLPVNLLPDIKYPSLTVWTELDGSSPEQVERLVTEPLEASIAGLRDIVSIKSESKESISLITIDFAWGTDMDFAVLYLREKLDAAALPETSGRPNILRVDPSTKPIMILSISGDDQKAVRDISEHIIKKRIEQTEGVAMADVIGGEELDIRIEADVEKLNSYGISFSSLENSIRSANTNSPGGSVKDDVYIYDLVISSEFETLSDIENTPVKQLENKRNIYVKDVAEVSYKTKEKTSFTRYNSTNSTAVLIRKDGDANAVLVAREVKDITDELNRSIDADINIVYDQSDFITESINNVVSAILLGGILSFLTLFLFLREFKYPFNISLAMPISIFSTFSLLYFSGLTLNLMSLSGFALGIGMLVDNSIVVLENIDRHRNMGKKIFDACYSGVKEVILPVSASTFTTIIVFMPVVFVSGVAGELFKDQSVSVAYALISSLMVAISLVPVLYNKMSAGGGTGLKTDDSIKSDNGPIFKTGIYWTILTVIFFVISELSSIPVDEHTFVYILFLAMITDPVLKTAEYFVFQKKRSTTGIKGKIRTVSVNLYWFILLFILGLPAVYISKIDVFEPVHAFIMSVRWGFLEGFDMALWDISSFINDFFQPYEEELSTRSFMLYSYLLGGTVFFINIFGLFNPPALYGKDRELQRNEVFYLKGIRNLIKKVFSVIIGFFTGLFVFYYKILLKSIKFISGPVLRGFDKLYADFEKYYHKILIKALDNKPVAYITALMLLMLSVIISLGIEKRMMPDVDSHEFILSLEMNPGTSIWTTESIISDYEKILLEKEGVISVFSTGGIYDEKSLLNGATVYKGDIQVKLENGLSTKKFINSLRKDLYDYNSRVENDIKLKINTDVSVLGEMLNTDGGDITVKVFGSDIDDIADTADRIAEKLSGFKELSEVKTDFSGGKPQIRIDFNNSFLESNNISESEVASFLKTMIKGSTAAQITENNKTIDIVIGTSDEINNDLKKILRSPFRKGEKLYPLSSLIDINYEKGPEALNHESQSRVITVSANLISGRLDRIMEKINKVIDETDIYRGMRIETGGRDKGMKSSMNEILFMFMLSFILVYMVLASQFESLLSPLIIVLSVPFAFIGVSIGLALTGQSVNILSGIGMIMLIGIVVNDAIVKVDFIENSVRSGKRVREAIIDASRKRLRPILMTTISTVFGMLPMAVSWGGSSELRKPLAVTVIFGLSAATFLILIMLPVIYETLKRD